MKRLINILFVVFLICGIVYLTTHFKGSLPTPQILKDFTPAPHNEPPPPPAINYGAVICDDAWEHPINHSEDNSLSHFTVPLKERCFSAIVMLPNRWRSWSYQHAPGSAGGWVAFWPSGQKPTGPMAIDDPSPNTWSHEATMRVEGKGAIIFFRTDEDQR